MSNLAKVTLEELEVDELYVTDVLKSLLHTIVFQRCLGEITPSECECESLTELHYPTAEIDSVNKEIDQSVKQFVQNLSDVAKQMKQKVTQDEHLSSTAQQGRLSGGASSGGGAGGGANRTKIFSAHQQYTIDLSFYSIKKTVGYFRTTEERTDWEKWSIPLKVVFYFDTNASTSGATSGVAVSSGSTGVVSNVNSSGVSNVLSSSPSTNNSSSAAVAASSSSSLDHASSTGGGSGATHRFSRNRASSFHKQSVTKLTESVEQRMKYILKVAHERIEHLPSVRVDDSQKCFPFKISLPSLTKGGGLWTGSLMDLVNWS